MSIALLTSKISGRGHFFFWGRRGQAINHFYSLYDFSHARIFRRGTLHRGAVCRLKKMLVSVRFFFSLTANCPTAKCPTAKSPRADFSISFN